jgi:hypothetical protein
MSGSRSSRSPMVVLAGAMVVFFAAKLVWDFVRFSRP